MQLNCFLTVDSPHKGLVTQKAFACHDVIILFDQSSFNQLFSVDRNLLSNPFACNCHLGWLSEWLKKRNIVTGNPRCNTPTMLQDMPIQDLKTTDFKCERKYTHIQYIPWIMLTGHALFCFVVITANLPISFRFNSLVPGRCSWNIELVICKLTYQG